MNDNPPEIERFVAEHGWGDAARDALPLDASTRSYARLSRNGQSAILMNAPPTLEQSSCPENATPEQRLELGYNATARLAGPNMHAFLVLADALERAGIHAPHIFASEPKNGFAIIEDLGTNHFADYIEQQPESELLLYKAAADVLIRLQTHSPSAPSSTDYTLLTYDKTAMLAEIGLLTEWFVPFWTGTKVETSAVKNFVSIWTEILDALPAPEVLVLRDYHAENLMWLPDEEGIARVGVIDFQDGLLGHAAYDLVSLLEDARRDVSPTVVREVWSYFTSKKSAINGQFNCEQFSAEYAILGAQRNAKILGIFARLINRDSKEKYKDLLPRVRRHFLTNLQHPALKPVKCWIDTHFDELYNLT